jgi:hypothetical protein
MIGTPESGAHASHFIEAHSKDDVTGTRPVMVVQCSKACVKSQD